MQLISVSAALVADRVSLAQVIRRNSKGWYNYVTATYRRYVTPSGRNEMWDRRLDRMLMRSQGAEFWH